MVGYALASLPDGSDVPWQRVINSQGRTSSRRDGYGHLAQRSILESEGVVFDEQDKVDLKKYLWPGPG